MFIKTEDITGPVCINMISGLRFRPNIVNGMTAGTKIIFPDGSTNINIREDYEQLAFTLGAEPVRGIA